MNNKVTFKWAQYWDTTKVQHAQYNALSKSTFFIPEKLLDHITAFTIYIHLPIFQ